MVYAPKEQAFGAVARVQVRSLTECCVTTGQEGA